jgi:peptidyl-prolyl cis-trans isomerase D
VIQNKFFKNIIKLLLLLLILAFAFGGLGDIFSKKEATYAIKISDLEYSFQQFNKILQEAVKESKLKYGKDITKTEILQLKGNVINDLIDSTLILLEAKSLGIVANDNTVKKEIIKIPVFFKDGKFNKDIFDKFIQSYGISEQDFIDKLKENIIRSTFINSISAHNVIIPGLTQIILQDVLHTRDIKLIKIPFSSFKLPHNPDEAELKTIYEKNKNSFKIHEKRIIDYVLISSKSLKHDIDHVSDSDLKKLYDEKSFLFVEPEKRDVSQIQLDSLDKATKAKNELLKGADFKAVTKKYASKFKNGNLGIITYNDFDEDISEKLFSLKIGETSEVIETPLGLYIFKVEKIIPEKKKEFNDVKDTLRNEYLKQLSFNKFLDTTKKIQNEVKQGKSIEYIVKNYNLKLETTDITKSENNVKNDSLIETEQFIKNAFDTKLNSQSHLFPISSNKLCILKVKKIFPEKDQKLEEIKLDLKGIWYDNQLKTIVNKLEISGKEPLNSTHNKSLFDFANINITNIQLSGNGVNNDIPLDFYKSIFELRVNEYTKPFIDYSKKEVLIANLKKVILPPESEVEKHKQLYEAQIQQMEQKIILDDILKKLKGKYSIHINPLIYQDN